MIKAEIGRIIMFLEEVKYLCRLKERKNVKGRNSSPSSVDVLHDEKVIKKNVIIMKRIAGM